MALDQCNGAETADGERTSRDFARLLTEAAAFLLGLWPDRPGLAMRLDDLAARLGQERLRIAVLGQFKRGKSTFLNALLGYPLLPTGVVPLTAIPTFLHWSPHFSLEAHDLDGKPLETVSSGDRSEITTILKRLVTEEGNPRNRLRVGRVDVFAPAPILADGIQLVDTPGIGSTLRHNTDAALAVLPECDAAFFVLSVDPPVTAAELEYLDQVRPMISPLFFILNKIDYFAAADRPAAVSFLRRALGDHMPAGEGGYPIFSVSARLALEAKQSGDEAGIENSGLAEIEKELTEILVRQKQEILRAAIARKGSAILESARSDAELGIRALEMPMTDLERYPG
jgi:hypothetical protein